jgi:hypothetical protein
MMEILTPEKSFMKCGIARFEEKYEITSGGLIWNKQKEKWQNQTQNPNGYMKVQLNFMGEKKQLLVHRLVALHFIPNPYEHPLVNHIDGDKSNNNCQNLEWIDESGNAQHALKTGLRKGFVSLEVRRELLHRVLKGEQVKDIWEGITSHPNTLSRMLRQTAEKDGLQDQWSEVMTRNRANAAKLNLKRANSSNSNYCKNIN